MTPVRILIFARVPAPGRAKTRLIPALGADGAAALARRMLQHTLGQALAVPGVQVELCVTPGLHDPQWQQVALPEALSVRAQGEGNLGERLACAAQRCVCEGARPLLVGTDCPALDTRRLQAAANVLDRFDAVIHGTADGGYALLGLNRFDAGIFAGIAWSTPRVFEQTVARVRAGGLSLQIAETLNDIDEPSDLPHVPAGWGRCRHPT